MWVAGLLTGGVFCKLQQMPKPESHNLNLETPYKQAEAPRVKSSQD